MKKIIKLTESDLTNIVKRVVKENAVKDSLIDMIKKEGWGSATNMFGEVETLKKLTGIESPMDYLNLFNDLDVIQSEDNPNLILYRYEIGNNIMVYNRKDGYVYIDYDKIWSPLKEGFNLNNFKVQKLTKEWLSEVYNLRVITTFFMYEHEFLGLS